MIYNYFSDILNTNTVQEHHLKNFSLLSLKNHKIRTKHWMQYLNYCDWFACVDSGPNEFWSLYEFEPFKSGCLVLSKHKFESFSRFNYTGNSTLSMNTLYPKKLRNFNQCPVFVVAPVLQPFSIIHPMEAWSIKVVIFQLWNKHRKHIISLSNMNQLIMEPYLAMEPPQKIWNWYEKSLFSTCFFFVLLFIRLSWNI